MNKTFMIPVHSI